MDNFAEGAAESEHSHVAGGAADPAGRGEPVSFVLVLWLEPQEEMADPEWRWRVKRVQTGEQAYFRCVPNMLAHISRQTGLPAPR